MSPAPRQSALRLVVSQLSAQRLCHLSLLAPLPGCRSFFDTFGVDQRQEIFRVKRVEASGLLSGRTQVDVNAPIIGQHHHWQIVQHLLSVGRSQVRILRYQRPCLVGSQLLLFANGPGLNVILRNAVLYEGILGAFHASLCEGFVVFRRAARICMATEYQMGIGPVFQVIVEVRSEGLQDLRLTGEQSARGILHRGPSSLKVNTMEGKPGFQLLDLSGRSRGRRRSFHVHCGGGRGRERRIAIITYIASDRDRT